MKIFIVVLFSICLVSCTERFHEKEVRALIEKESLTFYSDSDRNKFLDYWADSKEVKLAFSGVERSQTFLGKSEMKFSSKNGEIPAATMSKSEYSNFAIRASSSVAWAMFDQKATTPEGRETYTHEFRFLEKINGEWKIIASSLHQYIP